MQIPLTSMAGTGAQLYRWLGMFWTVLYQDKDFLRQVQGGRAMLASQAYLNLLEASALLDRRQAPVLHRERWYPLPVRVSEQGQGAASLKLGAQPVAVLGPQTDPAYKSDFVFSLGGGAEYANLVTYPIAKPPLRVLTCIVDNPAAPTLVLERNRDFVIQDGTLVLRKSDDPFANPAFPADDGEIVLWGCDAELDWQYVYEHIGYVFGITGASTPQFKDSVNAVWDITTSGACPALVRACLAAICGTQICKTEGETVETVAVENGDTLVITDANVYRLPPQASVAVTPGMVLHLGQFLDNAIKVYTGVTDTDAARIASGVFGGTDLRTDIPVVTLPQGCLRARVRYGLSAGWEQTPITYHGDDGNGNPKLKFDLVGEADDVAAFWADVWSACETAGVSLEACFTGLIDDTVVREVGAVWGYVEPLAFMLRNLIGANTVLVAVDAAQLTDEARKQLVPLYTRLFAGAVPAYTRLFVVEHKDPAAELYGLEESAGDTVTAQYAFKGTSSRAASGMPARHCMTFRDRKPAKRWLPVCG